MKPASGLRLAVVGKGGVGKSFIAGTLARLLAADGRKVVVLDSDPVAGAAVSMGMGVVTDSMLADAAFESPNGWRLHPGMGAATIIKSRSAVGPDGVRLLQSGKADVGGMSGTWPSIRAFGQVTRRLASDGVLGDWDVIGDLPAGPRHAAFNWAPYADTYLVVTTAGSMSLVTARRMIRLARQRGAEVLVVASRVESHSDTSAVAGWLDLPVFMSIPTDDAVREAEAGGLAPFDVAMDGPALQQVRALADRLVPSRKVNS
ncbi:MAG: P-loop NTPase [Acidimicrobiia bacterium]|nr:P-loop NTPase [Acidimicrobiia bacterium]